jgi:hypothetical protein
MFHKVSGSYAGWTILGYDQEKNLWLSLYGSDYYISALIGNPISVDGGDALYPLGYLYGGKPIYPGVGGYSFLWCSGSTWVINNVLGYGKREVDEGVDEDPRYTGDAWYANSSSSPAGTYVPCGTLKNSNPASIIITESNVVGWKSTDKIGLYYPVSDEEGTKRVGWIKMEDASAEDDYIEESGTYEGEMVLKSTDYYIWKSTKWTLSSALGEKSGYYWESDKFDFDTPNVFYYVGEDEGVESKTITFVEYFEGSKAVDVNIAQVALWL